MDMFATSWDNYTGLYWSGAFNIGTSFSFATQLHGGFSSASFSLVLPKQKAYELYSRILGDHVVVRDTYFNIVYEGFISALSISGNTISVSLLGYYSHANDLLDDRIYPSGVVTVGDVVEDAVGLIDSWNLNASWLSGANFDLMTDDPETSNDLGLDFTDLKIRDSLERCLGYGYSTADPSSAYLVLYNNRTPKVFSEESSRTGLDKYTGFFLSDSSVRGSTSSSIDRSSIFNKVYAVYANSGGGVSKTTAASDAISIGRYGTREGVVQNGGNDEGIIMAEDLRDYALSQYMWPSNSISVDVSGTIRSFAGELKEPYHIRAGHQVNFVDIDLAYPLRNLYQGQIYRRLSAFVVSTNYDSNTNKNTLTVGLTNQNFDIIMSRLGLSGGLK